MTAEEFVAELDADNQALLRGLEPDATLKPEIDGPLNVPNLLKVALKNEIEATEIAARWLVTTDDVRGEAGAGPAGGRRGQALPAHRRAPAPAGHRHDHARSAGRRLRARSSSISTR